MATNRDDRTPKTDDLSKQTSLPSKGAVRQLREEVPQDRTTTAKGAPPARPAPPPAGRPGRPAPGKTAPPRRAPVAAVKPAVFPRAFGPYTLLAELGRGGMGVVYRARDERLGRECALKVLLAAEHADDQTIERFRREAAALASAEHPNIVRIHESGKVDGLRYYSMELVKGEALSSLIERKEKLSFTTIATLGEQTARALHVAHRAGVIHRDVKPGNLLVSGLPSGRPSVKVTDFGLVRDLRADTLTQTGDILGTPTYLAPEQARGETDVDARADVYALGGVLYHLITGVPPHPGTTVKEVLESAKSAEPILFPKAFRPDLPKDLRTICLKCLERRRERRYETAGAAAEDLKRFLEHEPIHARPVTPAERAWRWCVRRRRALALAAGVVLLAVATTWGLLRRSPSEVAAVRAQGEREKEQAVASQAAEMEKAKEQAVAKTTEAMQQKEKEAVARAQAQKEEEKQKEVAKTKEDLLRKGEEDAKKAAVKSLFDQGDRLRDHEDLVGAVKAYDGAWETADASGREDLLARMLACCAKLDGDPKAAEAWRRVLSRARRRSFSDQDGPCAKAIACERVFHGTQADNSWKFDPAWAQVVEERLALYVDGKAKEDPHFPRDLAKDYLPDVRQYVGPPSETKEDGAPKDAAKLVEEADAASTDDWVRAKDNLVLAGLLENGGKRDDAIARCRRAWDWLLQAYPFYSLPKGDGHEELFLATQKEMHGLDSSVPERFKGELRIHCEVKEAPKKARAWGVKVRLSGMPRANQTGGSVDPQPVVGTFGDGDLDLGVADGTYKLTLEAVGPQGAADVLDEARQFGISFEGVPEEIQIAGERKSVLLMLRRLGALTLSPPADGASLDLQDGALDWKPVNGATAYNVVVEVPAKDGAGKDAPVRIELYVAEGHTAWLSTVLAQAPAADDRRLRDALSHGAPLLWGVDALGDLDRPLASSGPLTPLRLAPRAR